MIPAHALRPHMVVVLEGRTWRVLEVRSQAGGAQAKGGVHARLLDVRDRREVERRLRPDDRLETAEVDTRTLRYSYRQGDEYHFLDPGTYETVPVPAEFLGPLLPFLVDDLPVRFESLEGRIVGCRFPDSVELRVTSTGPPTGQPGTNVWKEAFLENGMMIKVPPFIRSGEFVRVSVPERTYLERVRREP
jgi:elongation factor P